MIELLALEALGLALFLWFYGIRREALLLLLPLIVAIPYGLKVGAFKHGLAVGYYIAMGILLGVAFFFILRKAPSQHQG